MAEPEPLSKHYADRAKFFGKPVPANLKHAPHSRARQIYGCDCTRCIPPGIHPGGRTILEDRPLTRVERDRRSRENLRGKPVPSGVKHGAYAYRVYGCPCEFCRKAKRVQGERKRNQWRETARGHWIDLPSGITVLHWPPADSPGWQCPECGEVPS